MTSKADIVCEASWEVCNKCGGIYTVVSSKAALTQAHYDAYYLIGPLLDEHQEGFVPQEPPETISRIFERLAKKNIRCRYGYWDIEGSPSTILVDGKALFAHLNDIKKGLWEDHSVDSLNAGYDFHEPLVWSWGVGLLLEEFEKEFSKKSIVGHFHEWLSGASILHLANIKSSIATVFTTHATMLGRAISGSDRWLYDILESIDPEVEAKAIGIEEKFTMERAAAHTSDIFSTVSSSTAYEAKHVLGREPCVLPNGLPLDKFPTFEQASTNHKNNKRRMQEYLMAHFFPYQSNNGEDHVFDLSNTLFFYTSGRYEFENKGLDVMIDALGQLNDRMKDKGTDKNIITFFFITGDGTNPKPELLENKNYLDELMDAINNRSNTFMQRFIMDVLSNDDIDVKPLPEYMLQQMKRKYWSVKRHRDPPLTTHTINEDDDAIIRACHNNNLLNRYDDKVKIVFIPSVLNGKDGLLNMTYYEAVSACHLGIFPSYYEPWGYTPLESLAHGVPAITTNLTGFGKYMKNKLSENNKGLHVIPRNNDRSATKKELVSIFESFISLTTNERVNCKINAHALATYADWRQLIRRYIDAHTKALKNRNEKPPKRTKQKSSQKTSSKRHKK